jgi:Gnt-I system high-affinity gluconate transporter
MTVLIVLSCIVLLILLITWGRLNAFLAFLFVSMLTALLLGIPPDKVAASVQKGIGDTLGSLVIVIVLGAMLGKIVAESGAARKITDVLMKAFGEKRMQWALMVTGFIVGIPLFYNVGFVLLVPLIFSVVYRMKLPAVYVGVPMLAALSVTHGFLPPHPSPTALVQQFHADLGRTLLLGITLAIPAIILAGPVFAKTLRGIESPLPDTFRPAEVDPSELPGTFASFGVSLMPVILLATTTLLPLVAPGAEGPWVKFFSEPAVVMMISLAFALFALGLRHGRTMKQVMAMCVEAVKDVSIILLIVAGAGALKQVFSDSGVSQVIADMLKDAPLHPLVLGWLIAAVIRVCIGSATVAGLTTAGIIAPLIPGTHVDPSLMVLSVGAGSLMFSHVNDSGFWMFKEYFNLSLKDTLRSWSIMETIVALVGLAGVMLLQLFL